MDAILHLLALGGLLFISQLSPGPDFLLVFRTSLAEGWRAGASFGLGITFGLVIQTSLVCWLGSQILAWEGAPYLLLAAAAYLMCLACRIFPRAQLVTRFGRQPQADVSTDGMDDVAAAAIKRPLSSMLAKGFLCNIFNMKCLLFLTGLCLHGLDSYAQYHWYIPALVIWFFIVAAGGWTIWACLLQWRPLREGYRAHVWLIDSLFAVLLFCMATKLGLSGMEGVLA